MEYRNRFVLASAQRLAKALDELPGRPGLALLIMLVHVSLGLSGMLTRKPFALAFYASAASVPVIFFLLDRKYRLWFLPVALAWLSTWEAQARALNCVPYISYEIGKYIWLIGPWLLLFVTKRLYWTGMIMLLLLIPAAYYDLSGKVGWGRVLYTMLAPWATAVGIAMLGLLVVKRDQLNLALRFSWLALVMLLAYLLAHQRPLEHVDFFLGSNNDCSAWLMPNQATTVLGLGIFLSVYAFYNDLRFSGSRWLDAVAGMLFTWQAMLPFSRGGMVVAVFCILLFLFLDTKRQWSELRFNPVRTVSRMVVIGLIFLIPFLYLDHRTDGKLAMRWTGNTEYTMRGEEEKGVTSLSTGRDSIFRQDINLWMKHPVIGVGAGASNRLRSPGGYYAYAHVEFTRLLSEHGLAGLIVIMLFLYILWLIYRNVDDGPLRDIQLVLFLFGLLSTFHSATRTFISPLLLSLGAWGVGVKKELHEPKAQE